MHTAFLLAVIFAAINSLSRAPPGADAPVERVAFGSCIQHNQPAPIFDAINAWNPDVFIFLGDNIYADTEDLDKMEGDYDTLADIPGVKQLMQSARVLYIWDDHDYGKNDAGAEWHLKEQAKKLMLDFFGEPADSPRRKRPGNFDSIILGPDGQRVQFILLDTRWFRSEFIRDPNAQRKTYLPNEDPDATVLGELQWSWLEEALTEPADVRIICTSIQLLAYEHRFEHWGNFPKERVRMLNLLEPIPDAIVLSGDRHSGEISLYAYEDGRVLPDVTSSALNQRRGPDQDEPNRYRAGPLINEANFGTLTFDWPANRMTIDLRDVDGKSLKTLQLDMAP